MNQNTLTSRMTRFCKYAGLGGACLSLGVFAGCNPEVAGIVLEGFQGLSEALLSAFFTSIQPEDATDGGGGGTTTMIISEALRLLA